MTEANTTPSESLLSKIEGDLKNATNTVETKIESVANTIATDMRAGVKDVEALVTKIKGKANVKALANTVITDVEVVKADAKAVVGAFEQKLYAFYDKIRERQLSDTPGTWIQNALSDVESEWKKFSSKDLKSA